MTRVPNYLHLEATHAAIRAVAWPFSTRWPWGQQSFSDRAGRGGDEPCVEPADLWQRTASAFRLMDAADARPDPDLTRRIAAALLDEVSGALDAIGEREQRQSLGHAVMVIRRELATEGRH